MAEEDKDSKTEEPTEKRLDDTRKKGRTAKSLEVNTVFILTSALFFFTFFWTDFLESILSLWREYFSAAGEYEVTPDTLHHLLNMTIREMFFILAPILFTVAVAGVISNVWQNDGWIFSWDPITPKFNKLNPLTGWKKFLGLEGLNNLVKSLAKLGLVAVAVYYSLFEEWKRVPVLMELPVEQTLQMLGDETFWLMIKVLLALLLIAIADFAYQKYRHHESMKMSKQEVRDERKEREGDPIVKSRIRQKQFEIFRTRMMAGVPEAEVIITNPTHLSVALRYDREKDAAPVLVAKGAGHMALKIREIAKEHDIPIMEDKPLAQTLFKNVEVGEMIPESLYKAVAEILAYVYRLKVRVF
ncbi:MAG: flagellar biosynthesis protein FlhB [Candidatus Nitrospinota bacterium M3_3B_026]